MGYSLEAYSLNLTEIEEILREGGISDEDELVSIVREHGIFLGTVTHASASAEDFNDLFLIRYLNKHIEADIGEKLVNRPIFGLEPDILPTWGYLNLTELNIIQNTLKTYEPEDEGGDLDVWFLQLKALLIEACEEERDLITLYL